MAIRKELLDELLKDYKKREDLLGATGILKELTKGLLERALAGELTHHLGYEKNETRDDKGNSRNGTSAKTVKTEQGDIEISVARDRKESFEPQIFKKHERRFPGFDDKIISMYARGMSTRDIQGHLQEIYGVEVSPELVSIVTESVLADVKIWHNRSLENLYPIVFLDAIRVKIRDNGQIINKAVYLAVGINLDGIKEVLGMWPFTQKC